MINYCKKSNDVKFTVNLLLHESGNKIIIQELFSIEFTEFKKEIKYYYDLLAFISVDLLL